MKNKNQIENKYFFQKQNNKKSIFKAKIIESLNVTKYYFIFVYV